jgi:hypothetical protein
MLDLECPLAAPNGYAIVAAVPCRIKAQRLRLRKSPYSFGIGTGPGYC